MRQPTYAAGRVSRERLQRGRNDCRVACLDCAAVSSFLWGGTRRTRMLRWRGPYLLRRLLLVTGIPCSGKTTVGRHLEAEHGFVHLDVELLISTGRASEFGARLRAALGRGVDVVITWGFWPGKDDPFIRELQRASFRMVWLDGDREVARRLFIERDAPSDVRLFDAQMRRIEGMNLAAFSPVIVDPFDETGGRLPRERLAEVVIHAVGT